MSRIPCGSDAKCQEDLREHLELYEQLHRSIESLDIKVEIDLEKGRYPLIDSIENIGDLAGKASEILRSIGVETSEGEIVESLRKKGEDELGSLASYLLRRIVFRGIRERVRDLGWSYGICPVCGLIPIAAISKKIPHGFFAQSKLELRCLCGFSWIYDAFRCPSCDNRARDRFEVIMINSLKIQRCLSCSHMVAIVDEAPSMSGDLVHVVASYSMARLFGEEGGGDR